jgi:uncharacterized Zn finger protein (UPF0148 family)
MSNEKVDKYRVDCNNSECGWSGYSTECVRFKHDTGDIFCPECHETVEAVADEK